MSIKGVNSALSLYLLTAAFSYAQGNLPPVGADWEGRYTNGIAAVVNKTIITVDELRSELAPLVPELRRTSVTEVEFNDMLETVSFDVLRNLINRSLIVEDFDEQGIVYPKVILDKKYDDYIIEHFNGDRAEFLKWLTQQRKTTRQFRKELRNKMIVEYMLNRMRKSESAVSPAKIIDYYQKNKNVLFYKEEGIHLRQIMLEPTAGETEQALIRRAEKILDQLHQGVSFAELAIEHSKDSLAKTKGGDHGWISRNDLAPKLAEVAFNLNVGENSAPIAKEGYVFIFHIEEKRHDGVQPLSKVQGEIEKVLAADAARKARTLWLERLRENAYIRYYL